MTLYMLKIHKALNPYMLYTMEEISQFKTYTNNNFEFSEFQTKACLSIVEDKHVLIISFN